MFKKASEIRNNMKLQIQKNEYAAAQALAQKFLVKVSTTNNSSVARNAANDLLPETNHFAEKTSIESKIQWTEKMLKDLKDSGDLTPDQERKLKANIVELKKQAGE